MESSYPVRPPTTHGKLLSSTSPDVEHPRGQFVPQHVSAKRSFAAFPACHFLDIDGGMVQSQIFASPASCLTFLSEFSGHWQRAKAGRARTIPKPVHKAWRSLGSGR